MNFTREPIIETIISPKDGYKLSVRSSRGGTSEEYFVDAIEVVSFGNAFFFRSLERPKAFLVPVMDYEVVEVKETRVALKNASHERNIKIGGGREAPLRAQKEAPVEKYDDPAEQVEEPVRGSSDDASADASDGRGDKKRDRRRHRRRRLAEERREWVEKEKQDLPAETPNAEGKVPSEGGVTQDETAKVSSSMFSTLFPPPSTLISETIARYKDKEGLEGAFFTKPLAEKHEPKLTLEEEEKRHHRLSEAAEEDLTIETSTTTTSDIDSDEE